MEIYEAERRAFSVGERIQVTRPRKASKGVKIANRAQATITALDAKGNGVLEFEDGRRVKWNASQMPHVDYAYAMTSYSLQYATAGGVLVHIDCGDSRIRSLLDRSLLDAGASQGANTSASTLIRSRAARREFASDPVTAKPVVLSPSERSLAA